MTSTPNKRLFQHLETPSSSESETNSEESSDSGLESEPMQQSVQRKTMKKKTSKLEKEGKKNTTNEVETKVKSAKRRRKRKETYNRYIYKVLKEVCRNSGISTRAMGIMNDFMNDIFERIATEASQLCKKRKSKTLTTRDIKTAVQLILTGELRKLAISGGTKAIHAYNFSRDQN